MALKTECCCGIQVHSGAKVAAWISIMVAAILGLVQFPLGLIEAGLELVVSGLMLYGIQKRRPTFYLPYLIVTTFGYLFQSFIFVSGLVALKDNRRVRDRGPTYFVVSIFFFLAIMFFIVYLFLLVPYRSYRLMKSEVKERASQHRDLGHVEQQPIPTAPPEYFP